MCSNAQAAHLDLDHQVVYLTMHLEIAMRLAISDAKARLTDLVRRAEAGEEVVLTRHGHPVAQLVALREKVGAKARADVIAAIRARAKDKIAAGPSAARSQDFLYDDDGLPR
jgi:prevent-host-death family protein